MGRSILQFSLIGTSGVLGQFFRFAVFRSRELCNCNAERKRLVKRPKIGGPMYKAELLRVLENNLNVRFRHGFGSVMHNHDRNQFESQVHHGCDC